MMYQQVTVQHSIRIRLNQLDRAAVELEDRHPVCCYLHFVHCRWDIRELTQSVSSVESESFFWFRVGCMVVVVSCCVVNIGF